MSTRTLLTLTCVLALAALLAGCSAVTQMATQAAQGSGVITEQQATSINRTSEALAKTAEDITPEQEYYIGRAVAATILLDYPALDDAKANAYLNELGQTLAMGSNRPETFGGYHFLLLDTDEINAFAAPGGLILVSRGLVNCCTNEDELAAVLAHEIAHVQNLDGLRAIKSSRLTSALTTIGVEAGRHLGNEDIRSLANDLDGSIQDVVGSLVKNGYARGQEHQADRDALVILERVGYDPDALLTMLEVMDERLDDSGPGFAKTHPSPRNRAKELLAQTGGYDEVDAPEIRTRRFAEAVGGL